MDFHLVLSQKGSFMGQIIKSLNLLLAIEAIAFGKNNALPKPFQHKYH
jgi:hypothetical protein